MRGGNREVKSHVLQWQESLILVRPLSASKIDRLVLYGLRQSKPMYVHTLSKGGFGANPNQTTPFGSTNCVMVQIGRTDP